MSKEIVVGLSGGDGGDNGGGGGTSRYAPPPPPFLTKTFQIVNDPTTNHIISWGNFGDSFIIWDHLQFTAQILPKYFRHNNFSSFVYQLNNYGFRKIGVENQWEYANKDFQEGKQHLLSNMKRRPLHNQASHRHKTTTLLPKTLKSAIEESKREIEKLKAQQLDMDFHITAIKQKAKDIEFTSKKLILTLAKACEIISKRERESRYDDDGAGLVVAKRKKAVLSEEITPITIDEDEENVASLSGKQPVSSSSEKETTRGNESSIDLNHWVIREMLEDDEVEGVDKNLHEKIAQDFQELLTNEADLHYSLEMKIGD